MAKKKKEKHQVGKVLRIAKEVVFAKMALTRLSVAMAACKLRG